MISLRSEFLRIKAHLKPLEGLCDLALDQYDAKNDIYNIVKQISKFVAREPQSEDFHENLSHHFVTHLNFRDYTQS